MNRIVLLFGIVVGVLLAITVHQSKLAGVPADSGGPLPQSGMGRADGPRVAHASGEAIETAQEAEQEALAEIPPEYNPNSPVARLLPAHEVGKWLDTCLGWESERPYWLVGVLTDGVPPFIGDEQVGSRAEGMYFVFSANNGLLAAIGVLGWDPLTYDSIVSLSGHSLSITYETPEVSSGIDPDAPTPEPMTWPTIQALPTQEEACRQQWW